MNYGETLAYWYLRLNGFFPLVNFVLHHPDKTAKYKHSADSDLLAIRFPYVYEEVGGREDDWDKKFGEWEIDLQNEIISLIVEVKTGKDINKTEKGVKRAFGLKRLEYGVQRIGIWQNDDSKKVAKLLYKNRFYRDPVGRGVIAKLLISDIPLREENVLPCLSLSLTEVDDFILTRMRKYTDPKLADRMFFPSDLMQYIIWRQANNHS